MIGTLAYELLLTGQQALGENLTNVTNQTMPYLQEATRHTGFEGLFAITGLLALAYMTPRNKPYEPTYSDEDL